MERLRVVGGGVKRSMDRVMWEGKGMEKDGIEGGRIARLWTLTQKVGIAQDEGIRREERVSRNA